MRGKEIAARDILVAGALGVSAFFVGESTAVNNVDVPVRDETPVAALPSRMILLRPLEEGSGK